MIFNFKSISLFLVFFSIISATDWIGTTIHTCSSSKLRYSRCTKTVYFHDTFSQWLKLSYKYQDGVERFNPLDSNKKEYIHSYMIIVSERSFGQSHLTEKDCQEGWRISLCVDGNSIQPFKVEEMDCSSEEIYTFFDERSAKFHPAYRVSFIVSTQDMPDESYFVLQRGSRRCSCQIKK